MPIAETGRKEPARRVRQSRRGVRHPYAAGLRVGRVRTVPSSPRGPRLRQSQPDHLGVPAFRAPLPTPSLPSSTFRAAPEGQNALPHPSLQRCWRRTNTPCLGPWFAGGGPGTRSCALGVGKETCDLYRRARLAQPLPAGSLGRHSGHVLLSQHHDRLRIADFDSVERR